MYTPKCIQTYIYTFIHTCTCALIYQTDRCTLNPNCYYIFNCPIKVGQNWAHIFPLLPYISILLFA